MADFILAYQRTNRSEGSYSCDPDDNGNWTGGKKGSGSLIGTNFGISAPLLLRHKNNMKLLPSDMINLTSDEAKTIFKTDYWDAIRGDEIISQLIANQIYDTAVNCGIYAAAKLAQAVGQLPITLKFDDATLADINHLYARQVVVPDTKFILAILDQLYIANYKIERLRYYNQLAMNPTQLKFLRGWINRTLV